MADELSDILLMEDNPGDAEFTREAFAECKVRSGFMWRKMVRKRSIFSTAGEIRDAVRPDLILLDLNTPRKSGKDVLKEIKEDSSLCDIPVIILTSSGADPDVTRSYQLHANCYIIKPVELEKFLEVVKAIDSFWLQIVKLPPHRSQG